MHCFQKCVSRMREHDHNGFGFARCIFHQASGSARFGSVRFATQQGRFPRFRLRFLGFPFGSVRVFLNRSYDFWQCADPRSRFLCWREGHCLREPQISCLMVCNSPRVAQVHRCKRWQIKTNVSLSFCQVFGHIVHLGAGWFGLARSGPDL